MSKFPKLANPRFYMCIFLSIVLLSVVALVPKIQKNGLNTDYYPDNIACIDEALGKNLLTHGIASYWDAKYIQSFSKLDLTIAQYDRDLRKFLTLTSKNYYRYTYDFAIINNSIIINNSELPVHLRLSKEKFIALNGTPKQIKECGDRTLFIYEKDGLQANAIVHVGDSYRWQACDFHSNIEDSCNKETGARSASPGQAGALTFGPYETFPSGHYSFAIRYASTDAPSLQAGTWDVVLYEVNGKLSQGQLTGTNGDISTISGTFTIVEEHRRKLFEIRTFKEAASQLTLYDITITRIE